MQRKVFNLKIDLHIFMQIVKSHGISRGIFRLLYTNFIDFLVTNSDKF